MAETRKIQARGWFRTGLLFQWESRDAFSKTNYRHGLRLANSAEDIPGVTSPLHSNSPVIRELERYRCSRQLVSGPHCTGPYIAGLLIPPLNIDADYEEPHGRQYFPKAEYQRVAEQISGEFG